MFWGGAVIIGVIIPLVFLIATKPKPLKPSTATLCMRPWNSTSESTSSSVSASIQLHYRGGSR